MPCDIEVDNDAEDVDHNDMDHVPGLWRPRDAKVDSGNLGAKAGAEDDDDDIVDDLDDSTGAPFSIPDELVPHIAPFRRGIKTLFCWGPLSQLQRNTQLLHESSHLRRQRTMTDSRVLQVLLARVTNK